MFQKMLVRRWMESQNDIDPVQLMQLTRMMDFAMRSSYMYLFRNSYETYSTVMHNTKPDPVYVYHTDQFTVKNLFVLQNTGITQYQKWIASSQTLDYRSDGVEFYKRICGICKKKVATFSSKTIRSIFVFRSLFIEL